MTRSARPFADNEMFIYSHARIHSALSTLVAAAVSAGTIRADADAHDLLRAMSGICMATDSPGSGGVHS